jgi:hypothetical protein
MSELDEPKYEFSSDMREEWGKRDREIFAEKLPVVASILSAFRKYGLYLYDVNLGNIIFEEEPE